MIRKTNNANLRPKRKTFSLVLRLYNDALRHHLWLVGASFICMAAMAAMASSYTYLMGPLVDKVFIGKDMSLLWLIGGAVVGIFIVRSLAGYLQGVMLISLGQKIVLHLQERLFSSLVDKDISQFLISPPSALVGQFAYDVNLLRTNICNFFLRIGKDTLTVWAMIALMFATDWKIALACVAGLPLSLLGVTYLGSKLREVSLQSQAEIGRLNTLVCESLSGIETVKAYGLETLRQAQITGLSKSVAQLLTRVTSIQAAILPVFDGLGGLALSGLIVYGGSQVIGGNLTPGAFVVLAGAVYGAYQPLRSLARVNVDFQTGLAAAQRVFEVIDRPSTLHVPKIAADFPSNIEAIRLQDVGFTYPGAGHKALKGVNITVPAGMITALVGGAGAGKSTVFNLILRFYDPDYGRVVINDQDIRTMGVAALRDNIALVDQKTTLFDDTITENIRIGRLAATEEDIIAAARAAGVESYARQLPKGLNTRIGAGGVGLSLGQIQRIGIARAFLRNTPVLLFDEGTSAQDAQSEQDIHHALNSLARGRTTIIISHRLETIRHADLIYVMDEGLVVESGTHNELLEAGGIYADLYALQTGKEIVDVQSQKTDLVQDEV